MLAVVIGIPVRTGPLLLAQTLESLRATAPGARVVLILDGPNTKPDAEMAEYLAGLRAVEQLPSGLSHGGAACLNRLIISYDAEVYVLLESGSIGAPGWLERLLDTFRRVPRCGLTGPSTNRSWNEQRVPGTGDDANVQATGRSVERRFGMAFRSLQPLHSLSDFCYAVRQEVVQAIGLADEGYREGPCWEMDYNIRAYRAGFLGVWTCGAYVHRAAEALVEPSILQHSKQRYQDKFCGLHLRGLKSDYRPHCRGEACVNFAPPKLIELKIKAGEIPPKQRPVADVHYHDDLPLVSCIMPTCNRRAFVPGAVACFLGQDYPHLELIVVDDGSDPVQDLLPSDSRIRYVRVQGKLTTGAKRNVACEQACGSLIAHWDDDDWHSPSRIRRQVDAMRGGDFSVGGTTTLYYRQHDGSQAFRYAYGGPGKAWMGAMIYTRAAWERNRFENIQVGEDVRFIARVAAGHRLDMHDLSLTVCSIHSSNTSPKATTGTFWTPERKDVIAAMMNGDRSQLAELPMVSCIMPTNNRRAFMALALNGFFTQTHPNKELVVIDDGTDPVSDLLEGIAGVCYVRVEQRMTIGAKRNLACEVAHGELIAHWDDDDWYAPKRLEYQATPLYDGLCDLNGLVGTRVLEMPGGIFWSISRELHQRMFVGDVHGGTLMFAKSLLKDCVRYPQANLAEDAALVRQVTQRRKRLLRLDDAGMFVYLRHGRNTWKFDAGRFVDASGWQTTSAPEGFPAQTLEQYRTACVQAAQ